MSVMTQDIPRSGETTAETYEIPIPEEVSIIIPSQEEQKKTREKSLEDRALKRMQCREKNHTLAEDLSKAVRLPPLLLLIVHALTPLQGDALARGGDYAAACTNYVHATKLWPSNFSYYLKLTAAYLKCGLYESPSSLVLSFTLTIQQSCGSHACCYAGVISRTKVA